MAGGSVARQRGLDKFIAKHSFADAFIGVRKNARGQMAGVAPGNPVADLRVGKLFPHHRFYGNGFYAKAQVLQVFLGQRRGNGGRQVRLNGNARA